MNKVDKTDFTQNIIQNKHLNNITNLFEENIMKVLPKYFLPYGTKYFRSASHFQSFKVY